MTETAPPPPSPGGPPPPIARSLDLGTVASIPPPPPPRLRTRPVRRAVDYLRNRPVLVLLLMSPGLPEYLSGSSPLDAIVVNPGWFILQLLLNLGLYGPGVLLIREASVRWKNGIIPVLLLGAAYGILEEGIALSTLFNPAASVVGGLGSFGHFMGINTVWLPGVLMVHMVYSIGLPIFLLSMAVPETRGRALLSRRGVLYAFAILAVDVSVLCLAVFNGAHFWMGWPIFLGSFAAIGALSYAAYRWPPSAPVLAPARAVGLIAPAVIGASLFTGVIVAQGLGETWGVPAAGVIAIVVTIMLAIGAYAYRWLRGIGNERRQLAFGLGLLSPIIVFGFVAQFPIVIVLGADVALVLWFARLLERYRWPVETSRGSPTGGTGAVGSG